MPTLNKLYAFPITKTGAANHPTTKDAAFIIGAFKTMRDSDADESNKTKLKLI